MASRNWVEISRGALRRNYQYVRRLAPETALCAVVKADAYGHGAAACARVFVEEGAPWLAVTSVEEGVRLRRAGIGVRILVLAGFGADEAPVLVEHRLTPAVWDVAQVQWLAAAAPRGGRFPIHLKLETGMGRLGASEAQEREVQAELDRAPHLWVEAVFSHLAASEAADANGSQRQQAQLAARTNGRPWHLLNSEGALRFPKWGGLMARTGLALYGYSVQPEHAARLEPALQWKTRVVSVKDLPEGHGIGYGARFRAPRAMRVATIAAGYADGYRRDFWPGAGVAIGGALAPVVGAISMDLATVDVSGIGAIHLGDEVVLLGGPVPAAELAAAAGTIVYEVLCGISARVERVYLE